MNAIRSALNALANLAASINALAATVTTANERLREQLAYDPPLPQLPHDEAIVENAANGTTPRQKARR